MKGKFSLLRSLLSLDGSLLHDAVSLDSLSDFIPRASVVSQVGREEPTKQRCYRSRSSPSSYTNSSTAQLPLPLSLIESNETLHRIDSDAKCSYDMDTSAYDKRAKLSALASNPASYLTDLSSSTSVSFSSFRVSDDECR